MRLRPLLSGALALAATSAVLCTAPKLLADTGVPAPLAAGAPAALAAGVTAPLAAATPTPGTGTPDDEPFISPALVEEIQAKSRVRSIIELKPGQSVKAVANDLAKSSEGSRILEAASSPHFFVAEVDSAMLARLRKDRRVKCVYRDQLSTASLDVSTALIRSNRANQAGWTGKGTTVAVLDTGIDRDHPFFTGRIVDEACFSSSDAGDGTVSLCPNSQPSQSGPGAADAETAQCVVRGANACSHGTHVAGIAAGRLASGAPSNGVAPEAGILPIQVFSRVDSASTCMSGGTTAPCFLSYTSDQKLALEYVARVARTLNVASVNMSLGGGGPYTQACDTDPTAAAVKSDFDALVAVGVAPVVAAGNNGFTNGVSAPACISTAVTVGATDDSDQLASFTNRGPLLDLFAPGVNINSSVPDNTYGEKSGTSMAAPHVAGMFALMKQAYPAFTVAQSLERLKTTGTPIRYDAAGTSVSTTRIDAERATAGASA
ncbi:S8 family serine peptidase [Nonomuraea phyllanthi]|uniref:S8 family peptidase n=1 Tax=Nonomuraea phyllanthi TaxID=2219224 RepID=UPI001293A24B|nr:S8 family serine peptidase [Nonomuraea phyllanthi]QFY12471.1 S8 family serine peptidase [Nonomuraea phyllanthi]